MNARRTHKMTLLSHGVGKSEELQRELSEVVSFVTTAAALIMYLEDREHEPATLTDLIDGLRAVHDAIEEAIRCGALDGLLKVTQSHLDGLNELKRALKRQRDEGR